MADLVLKLAIDAGKSVSISDAVMKRAVVEQEQKHLVLAIFIAISILLEIDEKADVKDVLAVAAEIAENWEVK